MLHYKKRKVIELNTRELGNTGIFVSDSGLGCMSIGTEEHRAEAILNAALDEGITYFDTADLYGLA